MALIGQIRKNSWILVVAIALGLGGFIFMDMFSGQQSVFGPDMTTMGEVEGTKVNINEFTRAEQLLYNNSNTEIFSRRDYLWNYFVEKAIIDQEAEQLGLGISRDELMDLQFGTNVSPIIRQRFMNPQTQQVDRQQLNQFRQAIENNQLTDPTMRAYWALQEEEIINQRLKEKISALVSKGLYAPTWMAEMFFKEQNSKMQFSYVQVPYDEIDNMDVTLSDADYEEYLEENKAVYENEKETRRVEYVTFNVQPTAADTSALVEEMRELATEFEAAANDTLFVEANYGSFDGAYFTKDQVNADIADTLFSIPVGSTYGPYMEEGSYKVAKVTDRKIVPDSVRSRHILLRANTQQEYLQAVQTADSLVNLLQTNQATFDTLAMQFGTDATRTGGGDLGYSAPGQMVKPFNDLIFFEAEEDTVYTVNTQFGIHVVEVTGKKFINNTEAAQVLYISQPIVPSQATQDSIYQEALSFVSQNRTMEDLIQSVAERDDLEMETSGSLERNSYNVGTLGASQSSRDIVRWAFDSETEIDEVSPEVYIYQDEVELFNNKYVIAALRSILPPGIPDVEDIKDQIEPQVINRKKAEMLEERMVGKAMSTIANEFNVEIDTANNVTFGSAFLPGLGNEPKVIAAAFNMASGETSEPIAGNSGVYVIEVMQTPSEVTPNNLAQQRRTASASTRTQVSSRLIPAIRSNADISDYRSRFY